MSASQRFYCEDCGGPCSAHDAHKDGLCHHCRTAENSCPRCGGSGGGPYHLACPRCNGLGTVKARQDHNER